MVVRTDDGEELEPGRTSDNDKDGTRGRESLWVGRMESTTSVSHSINQSSISNSTKITSAMVVAGSYPWSDSHCGIGSGGVVGTVVTGCSLTAGGHSLSVRGSGEICMTLGDGGLGFASCCGMDQG